MNKIHFSDKIELQTGRFVIPFTCTDIVGIDTEALPRDRSEYCNKVLYAVHERIEKVLSERGYQVEKINFSNMAITARKGDYV